jgi:hypothetical protein
MPTPETLADELTCSECGRRPLFGERWTLRFADLGEVAVYCPERDEREFGDGEVSRVVWWWPFETFVTNR